MARWWRSPGRAEVRIPASNEVPVRVTVRRGGNAAADRGSASAKVCAAPVIQLRLTPMGLVFPCCRSLQPLGHLAENRLLDIWTGARRRELNTRLAQGDYSMGCGPCGSEIEVEGWEASYAAIHDEWSGEAARSGSVDWPTRLDFNLSNSCNLQCVQCDGDSSSAIRIHREHRPPLPKVYDEQFFDDLREFIPHLHFAAFGGGEPLLANENFRVWDLIAEINPEVRCIIITNATQWTPRIERVLERLDFDVIVSLDGITADTYEAIRVGADFEAVMRNIGRFREYVDRKGTRLTINHCLMPSNAHEFADLLLWAEQRGLRVDVSVVRQPAHSSIAELPLDRISAIGEAMRAQDPDVRSALDINLTTWVTELERISAWAGDAREDLVGRSTRTVLWFPSIGNGPVDTATAHNELMHYAVDGVVHSALVDIDDRIVDMTDGLLHDAADVIGQPFPMLSDAVSRMYGPMHVYDVVSTTEDRFEATAVFGSTECCMIGVPLRDSAGRATEAALFLAFRPLERT